VEVRVRAVAARRPTEATCEESAQDRDDEEHHHSTVPILVDR